MKCSLWCALAVAGTAMTVSLAQMPTTPSTPTARELGDRMGTAMGMEDATSSNADRAFAACAISHARLSREVSEYVASKATNPDIKKLAQDISTEQQNVSEKIQAAAQKNGITLNPDRMLPSDKATLDFIKELPVASLERTYVFHLAGAVRTHQLMAQWAAKNAEKPEIRQVAQDIATKLEARDRTIDQLAQTQVNTNSRTASESP